ncbi:hypothetical protein VNO77_46962 [Canavalia gladiata]|uniref:Uncharacterized protein n=1 Tax=Canavalia gladiata TaxID=3824 RepID=A0AAN9JI26_CANGL
MALTEPWSAPKRLCPSLPNSVRVKKAFRAYQYIPFTTSTIPLNQDVGPDLEGFLYLPTLLCIGWSAWHALGQQRSQDCLWSPRVRFAFFGYKKLRPLPCDLEWFERRIGPILPSCDDLKIPPICGPTRWPLSLQSAIVTSFFGRPVGECVHTILSNALFDVPFLKSVKAISFRAGQPLGYYASWPLFTLTHHLVVMYCASKVIARETQT